MTLGTMREDALESLVVAEAIFDIDAPDIDVGWGVGAKALHNEILRITQRQAGDVPFRRLAPERHGAVDPEGDLGRTQVCQIAAEAGWDFDGDSQLSAPHALLQFRCGADRRAFGEIMRAREAFEQPAAFRRLVLVEGRIFQILDIERDAIAHGKHQNDRTDERECEPDRIAQELHRLAPGISP